jgi:hypothetical protein
MTIKIGERLSGCIHLSDRDGVVRVGALHEGVLSSGERPFFRFTSNARNALSKIFQVLAERGWKLGFDGLLITSFLTLI